MLDVKILFWEVKINIKENGYKVESIVFGGFVEFVKVKKGWEKG